MDDELRTLERAVLGGDEEALARLRDVLWPRYYVEQVQCPSCGGSLQRRYFDRHVAECRGRVSPPAHRGAIAATVHREPFWDRVAVPVTPAGGCLRVDVLRWTAHDPVDGRKKGPGDCNLGGPGWTMPATRYFRWSFVSVVPDAGSSRRSIETLWNDAVLEIRFGGPTEVRLDDGRPPLLSVPMRELMHEPEDLPWDEAGLLSLFALD